MEDNVVAEVARTMLDRVAGVDDRVATEQRMFPTLAQAYFRDRRRALTGDRRSGPLKFGPEDAVVFLTPVMLEVAHSTLVYLTGTAAQRGVSWSASQVRRLFGTGDGPGAGGESGAGGGSGGGDGSGSGPEEISAEQWVRVRQIIEEVLLTHGGLPAERAGLLADAIVGRGRIAEAGGGN